MRRVGLIAAFLAGVIVGGIVFNALSGRAGELALELGQCRFGQERNGTFYESDPGMDYSNYMTPRCGGISWSDKFGSSRWGYRIAYLDSGSIQARSNVARYGDDLNRQPCDPKTTIGCRAHFDGSGYTYGVSLGLTAEARMGEIRAAGEAGLFFFRHRFHASAMPLEQGAGDEQNYDATSSWRSPHSLLLGITLRYRDGGPYVYARHYFPSGHRELSLTNHSMTQFGVGFPLAAFW